MINKIYKKIILLKVLHLLYIILKYIKTKGVILSLKKNQFLIYNKKL